MKAYVMIKIHLGEITEAIRQMRDVSGVVEANMTFGPYDAIAKVDGTDLKSIGEIVTSSIQAAPGVIETLTCLVIDGL
jgi:DNA-binding Lrp family transcriptional regulator